MKRHLSICESTASFSHLVCGVFIREGTYMKRDLYIPMYTKRDLRVWKCVYEKRSIYMPMYTKRDLRVWKCHTSCCFKVYEYIYTGLFSYI